MIIVSSFCHHNLCYLSSVAGLLNIGLNRLGNVLVDNSLFCLLCSLFIANLINLNVVFLFISSLLQSFSALITWRERLSKLC
jgi:hypothetical protein